MKQQQYDVRCRHTDSYYLATIEALLAGVNAGLNDKSIALQLNGHGMLSATGAPWTAMAVQQALHKLRHSREKSSHLHSAMLQMHWDGLLTKAQVLPLLQPRNVPQVRM